MTTPKRAKVMAAEALPTYLLLVLRGLESLVEEEIRRTLEVRAESLIQDGTRADSNPNCHCPSFRSTTSRCAACSATRAARRSM
jgi:hypothetical protein